MYCRWAREAAGRPVIELWIRNEGARAGGGGDIRKAVVKAMASLGDTPDNDRT